MRILYLVCFIILGTNALGKDGTLVSNHTIYYDDHHGFLARTIGITNKISSSHPRLFLIRHAPSSLLPHSLSALVINVSYI